MATSSFASDDAVTPSVTGKYREMAERMTPVEEKMTENPDLEPARPVSVVLIVQ